MIVMTKWSWRCADVNYGRDDDDDDCYSMQCAETLYGLSLHGTGWGKQMNKSKETTKKQFQYTRSMTVGRGNNGRWGGMGVGVGMEVRVRVGEGVRVWRWGLEDYGKILELWKKACFQKHL